MPLAAATEDSITHIHLLAPRTAVVVVGSLSLLAQVAETVQRIEESTIPMASTGSKYQARQQKSSRTAGRCQSIAPADDIPMPLATTTEDSVTNIHILASRNILASRTAIVVEGSFSLLAKVAATLQRMKGCQGTGPVPPSLSDAF